MPETQNEWTVMFYFAGDNSLSPLIVSQAKAIQDAGFQGNTEVLVHFDSNVNGVPTGLFNVNQAQRNRRGAPKTKVGTGKDPFVHNIFDDKIHPRDIPTGRGRPASTAIRRGLETPDIVNAQDALNNFLGFCLENHPAKHYLLFLVGHGLIVGNDTFLPDDNPVSAITLKELAGIIGDFSRKARQDGSVLEMLAMHSCSMSAIEVAYQLKGTAKCLLASEGTSYIGGWPYRQLLIELFNGINEEMAKPEEDQSTSYIPGLMNNLYSLTGHNAKDFMASGYSLDLSLCNLANKKFNEFKEPFQNLVKALKQSLPDGEPNQAQKRAIDLIQLAHLESQSYWQEDYTDLYDFCLCLSRRCDESDDLQQSIKEACGKVIEMLEPNREDPFSKLILRSEHFGSKYQYSHGLSIYFPWCEPTDDQFVFFVPPAVKGESRKAQKEEPNKILRNYKSYAFTKDFKDDSWYSFLKKYFQGTQRKPEDSRGKQLSAAAAATAAATQINFNSFGPLVLGGGKEAPSVDRETGGNGTGCTCPSIKNYPVVSLEIDGKVYRVRKCSISDGFK